MTHEFAFLANQLTSIIDCRMFTRFIMFVDFNMQRIGLGGRVCDNESSEIPSLLNSVAILLVKKLKSRQLVYCISNSLLTLKITLQKFNLLWFLIQKTIPVFCSS